ncbi:hypothetical protein [Hymenobacter convexus]|uniref:hypothetical protein n=1 Tax=Hymenobacter sp. CA1UV-4 TaxID=3063782 RepID=UPI0027127D37|nr:hypothetical protein [Hymenobacter sp. CA1UV-4]MDO7850376.1 hypothetical protein [Hymenobacter sp. CA1UV-4]
MIRTAGIGCGLLFLMGWATGCRGERVAFQFQPMATQAAVTAPDTVLPRQTDIVAHLAGRLSVNRPVVSPFPRRSYKRQRNPANCRMLIIGTYPAARSRPSPLRLKFQSHSPAGVAMKAKGRIDESSWDNILFMLGGIICVAAVIIGIKLGGGLGLLIGVPMYIGGAYMIARGYGGPNKPASTSSSSALKGLRRKPHTIGGKQQPKLSHSLASTEDLGEITFTVGTLMVLVALILGLTGVLSGNAALLLGVVSFLLAIAAYNGFKW